MIVGDCIIKYVLFGYSNKEEYYKINDFERISKTEIDDFAEGMVMSMFQRKIYGRLLEWKQESEGKTALLVIGVDDNPKFG